MDYNTYMLGTKALATIGEVVKKKPEDDKKNVIRIPNEYIKEVVVPGEALNNYSDRETNEAGTHVRVVEHKEWWEKVPQPPVPLTSEEMALETARLEAQATKNRRDGKMAIAVGFVVASVIGGAVYVDHRYNRGRIQKEILS